MGHPQQPGELATTIQQWNEDMVFQVLGEPVRRKLLLTLARNGSQDISQLHAGGRWARDCALKHLARLCSAGLLTKLPNLQDGRRPLYSVSASLPIRTTPEAVILDFGFCTLRLK